MTITYYSTLDDLYQTGKINVRIYNALCRYFRMAKPYSISYHDTGKQIKIADICEMDYHKLMLIRCLGEKSVNLLCSVLESYEFAINGFKEVKETVEVKKHKMSPAEFRKIMKRIADKAKDDEEVAHTEADKLMCELLNSLGYDEGVNVFEEMPKQYS